MDIETQTIDIKEAAKFLGIGTRKLYQLCRDGKIPFILIGAKQYKFLPEALKDWLKFNNNHTV
jgi:excisionase family DNA binding protein